MKRMKKMILLLAALVILLGGYALMNRETESSSVTEETGAFVLTDKTAEDLAGLEWTKDDETFSFTRTADVWSKTDSAEYPVKQSVVETLASNLLGLKAGRKMENVTDAALYGLSEPSFTVTARWADGTSTTWKMGDETPFGDGYYLSLSDQNDVAYTVGSSLKSIFNKTMDDFAEMEAVPSVADADRITVGSAFEASRQEESSTINASQYWYAADGRALDGAEDLVTAFEAIAWDSLVEAVATEEQLAEWKLDDAGAVAVTCYAGEESASILFGAADENGNYYARLPGSSMVYSVAADSVTDLLAASVDHMISLALIETAYAQVQEAVFTLGGASYTLQQPVQEETEETEEAAEDPNEALWQKVKALTADSHLAEAVSGSEVLAVSVTTQNGASARFVFSEYSADSYTVTDGQRTMLVDAADVDALVRAIKSLL